MCHIKMCIFWTCLNMQPFIERSYETTIKQTLLRSTVWDEDLTIIYIWDGNLNNKTQMWVLHVHLQGWCKQGNVLYLLWWVKITPHNI